MPDSKKKLPSYLTTLRGWLTNNLGLKLLSVGMAIVLWLVVVYNDDTITRSRTVTGLNAVLTGQTTLSDSYLALVSRPAEALEDISVELEVPQSQYSRVNENNVRVRLDLSSVRTTGVQQVPLTVTTTYGTVKSVFPSSVEVEIEALDSRSVPVNATLSGKDEDSGYWYNIKTLNPSTITVSGASSIVQNVAMGRLTVDVSDMTETTTRAYSFQLFDYSGNEISQDLLTKTSSSVSATVEVYPTKDLNVLTSLDDVLKGSIADGYEVENVVITPSTITVAAPEELLETLTSLAVEPVQAEDVKQSFTVRTSISKLSDIRYYSAEQVYVTVNIRESEDTVSFSNIPITLLNIPAELTLANSVELPSVQITGPLSDIQDLTVDMLQVTIDLSGAQAGTNDYPVQVSVPGRSELTFNLSSSEMTITLEAREAAEANQ